MELHVRLVGLLQRVDLSSGSMRNMMELELEDGFRVTSPITETEAEKILHLALSSAGQSPAEFETIAEPSPLEPFLDATLEAVERGMATPPPTQVFPSTSYVREEYPARKGRPAAPPVRTVPADEMGNPIVPSAPATPQFSSFIIDDDGVPPA